MYSSSILLPSKLHVVKDSDTYGVYEIEGLYPGYGHTLGNSLRRVILSSLPGSAVTLVKIAGVDHEYSTMEGIKEDVLGLVLNLKRIRFRSSSQEPTMVTLKTKGAKMITASMIDGGGIVEVANPDQYLCEITGKNTELDIELTIQQGVGFIPREMIHPEKMPIGTIATDAIYTPIRKVNYEVENMRVGDRTDHNLLRMKIETDGTLTPREALEQSIMIMLKQMRSILDLQEEESMMAPVLGNAETALTNDTASEETESEADLLKTRIEMLDLSTRTANALSEANIRTVGGLVKKTQEDILALDGIGGKGVEEVVAALTAMNLALKEA
jgi:DNA-directed RNA polymerase subunit alpha